MVLRWLFGTDSKSPVPRFFYSSAFGQICPGIERNEPGGNQLELLPSLWVINQNQYGMGTTTIATGCGEAEEDAEEGA